METQIGRRKGVVLEDVAGFIWLDFWRMKLLCSLHAPLCNVKLGEIRVFLAIVSSSREKDLLRVDILNDSFLNNHSLNNPYIHIIEIIT